MDRTITASEANQRFSEMLRDVASGVSFTVTSRGKPVARMMPIGDDTRKQAFDKMLAKMRARPVVITGPWKREDLYD